MPRVLGIYRELQHSPNRESDDALILEAVLSELGSLGIASDALAPEAVDWDSLSAYDLLLPMCEAYPRLVRLKALEAARTPCLNSPRSVLSCYRTRMAPLLQGLEGISFPPSEIRLVDEGPLRPPDFPAPEGWWVKRGDVHNTCDRDVVFAARWDEVGAVLADFSSRKISHWVVQPHLAGDLVKFYGVGPGAWFTWFYHDPAEASRVPFSAKALAEQAAAGTRRLGLEIFGGDAIVSPSGSATLLDLNSWPSFARVRREAASHIARHVAQRLEGARSPR